MRSGIQSVKEVSKDVFNRSLKTQQKANTASFKESLPFKACYDLPLITMAKRLPGIKKNFKRVAFVGPNPYLFL